MTLFDSLERTERRPKGYTEPLFSYHNSSARPAVAALRALLEQWFTRFPQPCNADLRARFRSATDSQYLGAFWELYMHELLCAMGFTVQCHASAGEEVSTHPDFLVSRRGENLFVIESTLAMLSREETAEESRISQVYDVLNRMDSPDFFLGLRIRGAPATPPPGARLRTQLERWLATLNPDEVAQILRDEGFDAVPQHEWSHEGWDVTFLALPKSPSRRGQAGVRPVGLTMPEARIVEAHKAVRAAVLGKATKYGDLDLPFVVAVNVFDEFADLTDVFNGLFGEECELVTQHPNGSISQRPSWDHNGAWYGPRGPQNKRVSAVLAALHLSPWDIAVNTPLLIHNPWARRPLAPDLWPMPQLIPNMDSHRLEPKPGVSGRDILSVPAPWPVPG